MRCASDCRGALALAPRDRLASPRRTRISQREAGRRNRPAYTPQRLTARQMALRKSVTVTGADDNPVDAPFATDLLSRMSSGDLSRGVHCASHWVSLLDAPSHQKLRERVRATLSGTASPDEQLDVIGTTWLLRCLEDASLPLQPTAPWDDEDAEAEDVLEHMERLAVLVEMVFLRRLGHVDFRVMRISDAQLPAMRFGPINEINISTLHSSN